MAKFLALKVLAAATLLAVLVSACSQQDPSTPNPEEAVKPGMPENRGPKLVRFHAAIGQPSDLEIGRFNQVEIAPLRDNLVARVWTSVPAQQDQSEARGWLATVNGQLTLCFSPPPQIPASPESADTGALFSVLLTYEISGMSGNSSPNFSVNCPDER